MNLLGKSLGIPRIAWLGLATGLLMAQGQPATAPAPQEAPQSLADIARQLRAANANTPKAKHVYTNDTIPHVRATLSVVGPSADAPAEAEGADKTTGKAADKKGEKAGDKSATKEDETVWRAKFASLRANVDTETRRLDVLQRELNLAQLQAYSDPNKAMQEQFARTEIKSRQADIDQQKEIVATAQKAFDDAVEDGRKKGIPAGWSAPPK
jgi:hypothetical protein